MGKITNACKISQNANGCKISSPHHNKFFQKVFEVRGDYNLDLTLDSGQTFRWQKINGRWEGIIHEKWVRLEHHDHGLKAEVCEPVYDWLWLENYLQINEDLDAIIKTFPRDRHMESAVKACRGLRVVRQEPWECLATFLMSSNKQIIQIKQIVNNLCERFGKRIPSPDERPLYAFPKIEAIACASEAELRECKMGFRAAFLKQTAQTILSKKISLSELANLPIEKAREVLMSFPGVGPKIANCVLLFSLGFKQAFPVDVWVTKALRTYYFNSKPVSRKELEQFASSYFGKYGGYAQQYLFHSIRTQNKKLSGQRN